jgi:hypothetical protein
MLGEKIRNELRKQFSNTLAIPLRTLLKTYEGTKPQTPKKTLNFPF